MCLFHSNGIADRRGYLMTDNNLSYVKPAVIRDNITFTYAVKTLTWQ